MVLKNSNFSKLFSNVNFKYVLILCFIYTLGHWLLLFNDGIYMDDWVTYNQRPESTILFYKNLGSFLNWPAHLYNFFFLFSFGPILIKVFTFFCFLGAAILLYFTIKDLFKEYQREALLIALIFCLYPVNFSRVLVTSFHYSICYLSFFLGLFLFIRYLDTNSWVLRVLALIFCFWSFSMASLLVFYALVPLCLFIKRRWQINIKESILILKTYPDFAILPILFWVIKSLFFKAGGIYAETNYNSLRISLRTPLDFIKAPKISLLDMNISYAGSLSIYHWALAIGLTLVIFYLLKRYLGPLDTLKKSVSSGLFLLCGVFIFYSAVSPYILVDKLPTFIEWDDRYQMLIPLGASIIFLFVFFRFLNGVSALFVTSFFISLFITINISLYWNLQKDWFKQISLMQNFQESEVMQNHTGFLLKDQFSQLNAKNRVYRFYELTGFLKKVFGKPNKFMVLSSQIKSYKYIPNSTFKMERYNLSEFAYVDPQYEVQIHKGTYQLNLENTCRLIYNKLFNEERFNDQVRKVVALSFVKL